MLSDTQLASLTADFLEWTGGFAPETNEDIETYIATSMPSGISDGDARSALRQWMEDTKATGPVT